MRHGRFAIEGTLTMLATALLAACDGAVSQPTSPSTPFVPATSTYLLGWVDDPVGRRIVGASIEIVDGRRAGARTLSDESGFFAFDGGPTGAVTLRTSRADFASITTATRWTTNPSEHTHITLKPLEPPLPIVPGEYTLTFISDPTGTGWFGATCPGFPPEFLSRTYEATIARASLSDRLEVRFRSATLVKVPGPFEFGFSITQAGHFVGFELEIGFNGPTEELPGNRYVNISGSAPTAEPATLTDDSLTIPFWGTFEYCQLSSPMGGYHSCNRMAPAQRLEYYVCSSRHDRVVLTKR